MGKSITPKYRIVVDNQRFSWNCKEYGKPTDKNLAEYVYKLGKSYELGGCNEHISKQLGYIPYPTKARIETNVQYNPVIMAEWKAAMFQCW